MANTVSVLTYANTFGDWVVTTNSLAKENNDLAANNFVKGSGTLFLNEPTLGLQVANNTIIGGQLLVQGIGSSATVQNNLTVGRQLTLSNTTQSLTALGQANIAGPVFATASGTGLQVSNNAVVLGALSVSGAETLGGALTVGGLTTLNSNLTVNANTTVTGNVVSQNYVNVTNDVNALNFNAGGSFNGYGLSVIGNGTFTGQVSVGGNFIINGSTVYNTDTFTISAGAASGANAFIKVNRGTSGANATIRWNEASKFWDMLDVNDNTHYRMLHNGHLSSLGNLNNTSNVATSAAVFSANTFNQTYTNTANTFLKNYIDASNTSMKVYVDGKTSFTVPATFTSDLTVSGNLIVNGVTTTVNTNTVAAKDSLIKLADGNAGDSLDMGFYGQYNSSGVKYAGLFRKAADRFYLVRDVTTDPTSNAVTFTSANRASLDANLTGGTVTGLSSPISVSDGGLGVTSLSGVAFGNGTGAFTAATGAQLVTAIGTSIVTNAATVTGASQTNITSLANLTTVGNITSGTWSASFGAVSGANLTNLTAGNLTGTIPSGVLGNSSLFVGTTQLALNRGSAAQTLTGVNIDGTAGSVAWTNVTGRPTNVSSFTNDSNYIVNGSSSKTINSLYSNIIYDSDNNGYYLDLNSTSRTGRINSDYLYSYDNVVAYSDGRVKTNIKPVENALDKTCSLQGVYYTRTDLEDKDKKYLGVIAQEVQKYVPEVVETSEDGSLAVAYGNITALLIEAIKELKAEIDTLKQKE